MRKLNSVGFIAIFSLLLSGCASSLMQKADFDSVTTTAVKADHAQIIFMRPSSFGGAIQSSVFDLKQENNRLSDDQFIGIVSATAKVRYDTTPGFHLFMVVGENADFIQANLAAGKTYYALVTPRFGWWKARFSLEPLHQSDLNSDDFEDWLSSTDWYENTDASRKWAKDNWSRIQNKKTKDLKKWKQKPDSE